jgi:hypothetical protein
MQRMDSEVQRRLRRSGSASFDPFQDYTKACANVKRAHSVFKASRDKRLNSPSAQASENYARALAELDICTRVLEIHNALAEAS